MKKIILILINFYQKIISPDTGILKNFWQCSWGRNYFGCRFYPTCSEYCKEAIIKNGLSKGLWQSLKRLMRCHPLSKGGYDPVKQKQ